MVHIRSNNRVYGFAICKKYIHFIHMFSFLIFTIEPCW